MTTPTLNEIAAVSKIITVIDEQRKQLMQQRDHEIVTALNAGATWAAIQDAAQFASPRSISRAIERNTARITESEETA